MIGPKTKELFVTTVSENAGKQPTSFCDSKRHEASDGYLVQSVKDTLTITQCLGKSLVEIRSLLIPQSC